MSAEKQPYAFILGQAHSGSTLLAFLLNAHPQIATLGEIDRLNEFIPDRWRRKRDFCSCGKRFFDCPHWNRVLAGFAARGHGFDEVDYFAYRRSEKQVADAKLKALVDAVLDVTGKRVFLDASKYARYLPALAANPYLDLRVINLYRDGRALINSWFKHLNSHSAYQRVPASWRKARFFRPLAFTRIILSWKRREKERQTALARIPSERVHSIRYEDLATSPQATLRKVFAFLGVAEDVDVTAGYKTRVEHHIIGNQMRLSEQENIVFDEKWRENLDETTLKLFRLLGGEALNHRVGY